MPAEWVARVTGYLANGQAGRAMGSFLTEIVGLTAAQIEDMKNSPAAEGVLPIVSATMAREAAALAAADLPGLAASVTVPVLLILGSASPRWAQDITAALAATLPAAQRVLLPGTGHEAIDTEPELISEVLRRFLG